MKVDDNKAMLRFTHADGLTAKGGALAEFEIAGADEKFVPAVATIAGQSIVVSSTEVATPVAVRYAWKDYPKEANLYNGAGLPAAPFRTDHWDALTPIAARFTGK
jgi:sialate O-acetylesterase